MNKDITIKQILLRDLDYEKAAELIRKAFKELISIGINSPTAEITVDELVKRKFDYCFCAYNSVNELIGIFLLKAEEEKLYLDIAAVKLEYQRQGISKRVFKLVDILAKEKNCKCVYLNTMETAKSNIKLYEYLGYKKTNFKKHTDNYFSIELYKYFTKNKLRDFFLFLKFNLEKFLYKKIIYKSPKEITKFGFLLKKIKKNVLKK